MKIKKRLQMILDEYDLYITNNIIGNISLDEDYKYLVYTKYNFVLVTVGNTQDEIIDNLVYDIFRN